MQIQVSGKHIDIGDALRGHVEQRLTDAVGKFFEKPVDATVVFSRDRHEFVADSSVNLGTGMSLQAKSKADEIYSAFEGAVDRMEKQLRRYKRRLKDHRREIRASDEIGLSYILAGSHDEDAPEPDDLQPVIIAEMETRVPHLSVGEAVMRMELASAPLLVFRNSADGGVNVVYRRDDGNIGWIDPRNVR